MTIQSYVSNLALKQGIDFVPHKLDDIANAITQLADDVVVTDATEDLLVALHRAKVIDQPTMVLLLGQHYDECFHV
jgi:hypothetical protein